MIGTSYEMLMYFSVLHNTHSQLGMSSQMLVKLREKITHKTISEHVVIDLLSKLDCVMVRPAVSVPYVVQDRDGIIYSELDYLRRYTTDEVLERVGLSRESFDNMMSTHRYPTKINSKRIIKKTHGKIIAERVDLPSVWSYEPTFNDWMPEHTKVISRMLGCE